jgi:hypothetical protein
MWTIMKERERHTYTQRREGETDRQTDKQTHSDKQTDRQTDK